MKNCKINLFFQSALCTMHAKFHYHKSRGYRDISAHKTDVDVKINQGQLEF